MKNVKFYYVYRDGGNYKTRGEMVFANPDGLTLQEAGQRMTAVAFDGDKFIAEQVGVPLLFPYLAGRYDDEIDHCFHELDFDSAFSDEADEELCIEGTDDTPTDGRTLAEFVAAFEAAGADWDVFDPAERYHLEE